MRKDVVFLFLLVSIPVVGNFFWIYLNNIPPYQDAAGHTNLAYLFANIFTGRIVVSDFVEFLKISIYYPPFMHIFGGIVLALLGYNFKYLQYFSVLFVALSSVFMYLYAKKLTNSSRQAFFATSFFVFFPHIWEQSRHFMLDLPLTTALVSSWYFLISSQSFRKKKYVFLFFLCTAIAQVIKWYAFLYLAIPFLLVFIEALRGKNWKFVLSRIFLPITIAALFVLPWYVVNLNDIFALASISSKPGFGDPTKLLSINNFLYYPLVLINNQIVSFQALWLIVASVLFAASHSNSKKYILLQIFFIYFVLLFIGNKNLRYIMPLSPYFALIMGHGIEVISEKSKGLAATVFLTIVFFSIGFYTMTSFNFPIHANLVISKKLPFQLSPLYLLDASSQNVSYLYSPQAWSSQPIVEDLLKLLDEQISSNREKILVVSETPYISVAGLRIFSLKDYFYLNFVEVPEDNKIRLSEESSIKNYLNFKYILIPNKNVGEITQAANYYNLDSIRRYILSGKTRDYELIKTYDLPNKDNLYLLKKNPGYNSLSVLIAGDELIFTRNPAVANIYIQLQGNNDEWIQKIVLQNETSYKSSLVGVKRFRIDYPPELLKITLDGNWAYSQGIQFDRIEK